MVLGVCHDVLRHYQDAEDAAQATFLTLAKQGRSIRALSRWRAGFMGLRRGFPRGPRWRLPAGESWNAEEPK